VLNVRQSLLTRMQAVRYFVAFKVVKAAESVFKAVTCCSGCFSAYRREAILPSLDWWEHQSFLGRPSTFGDDRSLTNCVLRHWKVVYESKAVSHTMVPDRFTQFLRQQTRWKRPWTRESLLVGKFIWRKHPVAALSTYVGMILPLLAPIAAVRALVWHPLMDDAGWPLVYLAGIYSLAVVYGLYFALRQKRFDTLWVAGILFVFFYLAFLLWQTYYAILTARSSKWGTRPATAGAT
jgi:hyaluronan synthase